MNTTHCNGDKDVNNTGQSTFRDFNMATLNRTTDSFQCEVLWVG